MYYLAISRDALPSPSKNYHTWYADSLRAADGRDAHEQCSNSVSNLRLEQCNPGTNPTRLVAGVYIILISMFPGQGINPALLKMVYYQDRRYHTDIPTYPNDRHILSLVMSVISIIAERHSITPAEEAQAHDHVCSWLCWSANRGKPSWSLLR